VPENLHFLFVPEPFVGWIFPQGLTASKGLPTTAEFCHI
jgi:hypothetical protein